ncbi:MAG TPA: transcriptional regulator CynR [Pseudolabrys sp.]|nr:transcriptional regulator CynR [Pseudolabrys sp.]
MELRHLRYFLAVADTRSFTRAADKLNVTQPTLSHQIKQLEQLIGTTLFERSARDVELTAAGRLFRPYCERILKEIESSALALSELEGLMRGTLHMGVFHSFSNSLLPPILAEFTERHPGVHVVARLVPRSDMERDLLSGALDFAVAYLSEDTEHIVNERLFEEALVLVVGARHSLAARKSVRMRELARLPLVSLSQEFGARQFVDRFFAAEGLQPHIVLEMNAIEPILSTIRNSELACVLSAGAIVDAKGLRAIKLVDPQPQRTVGILWRRHGHRSAAAQRMADMIRAAYGRKEQGVRGVSRE